MDLNDIIRQTASLYNITKDEGSIILIIPEYMYDGSVDLSYSEEFGCNLAITKIREFNVCLMLSNKIDCYEVHVVPFV